MQFQTATHLVVNGRGRGTVTAVEAIRWHCMEWQRSNAKSLVRTRSTSDACLLTSTNHQMSATWRWPIGTLMWFMTAQAMTTMRGTAMVRFGTATHLINSIQYIWMLMKFLPICLQLSTTVVEMWRMPHGLVQSMACTPPLTTLSHWPMPLWKFAWLLACKRQNFTAWALITTITLAPAT